MIIVEVGSLNMDLVVQMSEIPKLGETLLGGLFRMIPGGKGANQAVSAARLGAKVFMIGCVGHDTFGETLITGLNKEGIDVSHIHVLPKESTGVALIQVDSHGQNTISVASGANFCLTSADVEKSLKSIGRFDALVMPLETPLETIYAAAKIASQIGAKVIFNPAPAQTIPPDLLVMIDVLVPNEHEIGLLNGRTQKTDLDINLEAEVLISQGLKHLLVTLGCQGSVYFDCTTKERVIIPTYNVKTIDTTAAGDCFIGALSVALCEGQTIVSAAGFASAASAISVTRIGAQSSLPTRREVVEFMANHFPSKGN
jgi:ribokinase